MQKVSITQLSEPIQRFLDQIGPADGMLIEDELGRARFGIIPYSEATPEERAKALAALEALQRQVGDRMRAAGRSEAELDRILQEDD